MKIGSKTKITREVTRQERNRRNNLKRITISAIVAFIIFIALTIIQSSILNQETKISVYQVSTDIESGTKITKGNINKYLSIKDVQASLIPDGYITDPTLIVGKFVNRDYKAKDIITVDGLKDNESLYSSNIKNPVKISFSIDDISASVSGTLREGDYINIYGMKNGHNKAGEDAIVNNKMYTFKHVYIDKAYDGSGNVIDSSDKKQEATLFTITIEENDAEMFNEMVANCDLRVAKLMYNTSQDYKAFMQTSSSTVSNVEQSVTKIADDDNDTEDTTNTLGDAIDSVRDKLDN